MSLSPKDLAKFLNNWDKDGKVSVSETRASLTVRNVREEDAPQILAELETLQWPIEIEDASEASVPADKMQNGLAPFKFVCTKPAGQVEVQLLTDAGLRTWLDKQDHDPVVKIGALEKGFTTYATSFIPWGDNAVELNRSLLETNPRRFVREVGERRVPENLSRFVLVESSQVELLEGPASIWAGEASRAMARSLCSEVENNDVIFRGPPASRYPLEADFLDELELEGFNRLTDLARWVFEFSAEAETRHGLAVAELARWPAKNQRLVDLYRDSGATVLESAKIAHQMGLQKISTDSMKILSDLRKTVADEASKLNDVTRQLAGAVSGALFGGAAVVIARLSLKEATDGVGWAIIAIAIVFLGYVFGVALSGCQFIRNQRALRVQWRDKLYRFLSTEEYDSMVERPAVSSERVYWYASIGGVFLAFVLSTGLIFMGVSVVVSPRATQSPEVQHLSADHPLQVLLNSVSIAMCTAIAVATLPVPFGAGLAKYCKPKEPRF